MTSIFDEMRRMQREMESMFDSYLDRGRWSDKQLAERNTSNYKQPLADIFETDDAVIATVELPGVDKDNINVEMTTDGIEVKVEKHDEHKDERQGMYRLERSYSGFYRHIPLPTNIDRDNIEATYKNGVLELRIPKATSNDDTTKIEVK
jgi:HSP20 family protein